MCSGQNVLCVSNVCQVLAHDCCALTWQTLWMDLQPEITGEFDHWKFKKDCLICLTDGSISFKHFLNDMLI